MSQLAHALQAAQQAEQAGAAPPLIAAALLHDIGHLLTGDRDALARGEDGRHEDTGAAYLAPWFGPAVTEPIRLHVAAKRYLVAADDHYRARLSPGSVRSLELQGGAYADRDCDRFMAMPYADNAVALRIWDEGAKVAGARTPPLEHYRPVLVSLLVVR